MQTFEYFFGLRLAVLLLRHSDNLSGSLQPKDLYATGGQKIWKKAVETAKKMRCEEECKLFWKDVQNKATYLCIDPPKLPTKRRAPPRIEECLGVNAAPDFDQNIISYYKNIYHESLDCITDAITDRID